MTTLTADCGGCRRGRVNGDIVVGTGLGLGRVCWSHDLFPLVPNVLAVPAGRMGDEGSEGCKLEAVREDVTNKVR